MECSKSRASAAAEPRETDTKRVGAVGVGWGPLFGRRIDIYTDTYTDTDTDTDTFLLTTRPERIIKKKQASHHE